MIVANVACFAEMGVYAHFSPSLPTSNDWIEHVADYPVMEIGLQGELTTKSPFNIRFGLSYGEFPAGNMLDNGRVYWISIGPIMNKELTPNVNLGFGPQLIIGNVEAEGVYNLEEDDSTRHLLDFEGMGGGAGIGVVGELKIEILDKLVLGPQLMFTYFSVKDTDVEIVASDYYHPEYEPENLVYYYKGDYVALSFRIIIGGRFGKH